MPEQSFPGVYVDEILKGLHPIEGVSTSTVGFVGATERGPTSPTLVTSWAEFEQTFGGFIDIPPLNHPHCYLPYAVRGFFDNGGRRAYIARVVGRNGARRRLPRLDEYVGDATLDPEARQGLAALATVEEISLLAAPDDVVIPGLRDRLIETCEAMKNRFAVTSLEQGVLPTSDLPPTRRHLVCRDVLPVDPSRGAAPVRCQHPGAEYRPRPRDLCARRSRTRGTQGSGQRGDPGAGGWRRGRVTARVHGDGSRAGTAQHPRHQCHPRLQGERSWHPRLGRAGLCRPTRISSTSTCAGC